MSQLCPSEASVKLADLSVGVGRAEHCVPHSQPTALPFPPLSQDRTGFTSSLIIREGQE